MQFFARFMNDDFHLDLSGVERFTSADDPLYAECLL
jgi:hypothetical protein